MECCRFSPLQVGVTERTCKGIHRFSDSDRSRIRVAQVHAIVQRSVGCGWVCKEHCAVYRICALLGVEILPCPPYAINLTVVKEEPTGRSKQM